MKLPIPANGSKAGVLWRPDLLLYAGVCDVRLLDGGTAAWTQAGLLLAFEQPSVPVAGFGLAQPACPHYMVNTAPAGAHRWRFFMPG